MRRGRMASGSKDIPNAPLSNVIRRERCSYRAPDEWEGENPYSQEAQVELVIGLMDALAIGQAILVGNSAGGTISMLTALEYPQRVQSLILVDPSRL
jgi:pimeloyl-ACP methyl ester carboxylesterase